MLDSDTVLTGLVLDVLRESSAPFLVDDEKQSDADTKKLYYDWEKVRKIDRSAQPPAHVFTSGQCSCASDLVRWFARLLARVLIVRPLFLGFPGAPIGCGLFPLASADLKKFFDLVWCFEVAEHLGGTARGRGDGHSSEQPQSYWEKQFADHSYELFAEWTAAMRKNRRVYSEHFSFKSRGSQ